MFKDEESITFKKMHNVSPADGFAEISENLADMIKFLANEPSVGLFYVQQHTQKAVPNLVNLKNNVVEKSHMTALHTEDLEDSITTIGSMKECGIPTADEMIKEIKKSISIMSTKKPKRGLLYSSSSGFLGSATSWSPATWGSSYKVYSESDVEKSSGYLSGVFKSSKQRSGNFKWTQVEPIEERESKGKSVSFDLGPAYPSEVNSISSSVVEAEAEGLPLSSENSIELQEESELGKSSSHQKFLSFKWTQVEPIEERESKGKSVSFDLGPAYPSEVNSISSSVVEAEVEGLPLSSENSIELQEESELGKSSSHQKFLSLYENYDEFKADKEARFEEWLGGSGNGEGHEGKTASSGDLAREGKL